VTFSFTPDTYDPNATLVWLRSLNGINDWRGAKSINMFEKNMIYYMITTGSDKDNDEAFYAVLYYNDTLECYIYAGKITLEGIVE
jgi:hypothetical protein